MIHKIRIENFFSIAQEQELHFEVPENAPDLPCFRLSRADQKIRLPAVVGFFGPNASGKSTILRAVISAAMFVVHSFDWANDLDLSRFFQPYRQKNWWGRPTKIIIEFDSQLGEKEPPAIFRYTLHIGHKENDLHDKVVLYEALSYAPKGKFRTLFKREGQHFHFGSEFDISGTQDPRAQSIRPNASVISTLTKFNHPLSQYLSKVMGVLQTNVIGFYTHSLSIDTLLSHYKKDTYALERLNKELRRLDVGLESMTIEEGAQGLFSKFQHVGLDNFIYFDEESAGTKRFIEIFAQVHAALEGGGVVMIDEIDSDLHPLLLPELFRWFGDAKKNPQKAQLFFTAHNPALLDDLEKEQIFFTEKPSGQSTQVYCARDIKGLRREPSLMKKYLAGVLGAVPHIG